jgi:hypothetical protein
LHCHIGVPELRQLVNSQEVVTDSSLGARPIVGSCVIARSDPGVRARLVSTSLAKR